MITSIPLVVAWTLSLGAWLVGWVTGNVGLAALPQFVAIVLAVLTVRVAAATAPLRHVLAYRAALGLLLASSATVVIAGGSTVAFADDAGGTEIAGLVALASTNLLIAVLSWRAIMRPAPRRAAIASLLAVTLELVALVVDLIMNLGMLSREIISHDTLIVTILATFATTWAGALVAIAALTTFERPGEIDMPSARIVDGS